MSKLIHESAFMDEIWPKSAPHRVCASGIWLHIDGNLHFLTRTFLENALKEVDNAIDKLGEPN